VSQRVVAFLGKMAISSSSGVTASSNQALWVYGRSTDFTSTVLREGGPLLGSRIKVIHALTTRTKAGGQGNGAVSIGTEDQIALRVTLMDGRTALGAVSPSEGLTIPYVSGGMALGDGIDDTVGYGVGARWQSFGTPVQNHASGALCFLGTIKPNTGTATHLNNVAIFSENDTTLVLTKRFALRDSAGITGGLFSGFCDPVSAGNGALAFIGKMAARASAGIGAGSNDGVWYHDGSALELLAREGSRPPGVPYGARWKSFSTLALPDGSGPVFVAALERGRAGITSANDKGIWVRDRTGKVQKLLQKGDPIKGQEITSFQVLGAVPGSPAQTRSFNNRGEWLIQATDASGDTHLLYFQVP
jgi:hypothetical protein